MRDPAIDTVARGGRPRLRAWVVQGWLAIEDDANPGLDVAELRRDAHRWSQPRTAIERLPIPARSIDSGDFDSSDWRFEQRLGTSVHPASIAAEPSG